MAARAVRLGLAVRDGHLGIRKHRARRLRRRKGRLRRRDVCHAHELLYAALALTLLAPCMRCPAQAACIASQGARISVPTAKPDA